MCLFFSAGEDAEGGAAAEGAAGATDHTVGGAAGATGPASYPTMQHTHTQDQCLCVSRFCCTRFKYFVFLQFPSHDRTGEEGAGSCEGVWL